MAEFPIFFIDLTNMLSFFKFQNSKYIVQKEPSFISLHGLGQNNCYRKSRMYHC